ncbi:MAG: immunoglobulin domain-containing protein [Solirubrobacteraceae bacterium]
MGITLLAAVAAGVALLSFGLAAGAGASARSAPPGLLFLHSPARADAPAIFAHTGHYNGKPRATLFTAIPATLPSSAGAVRLKAVVQGATVCRFSSAEKLTSLPAVKHCASGTASTTVQIPKNTTSATRTYRFALSLKGPHGKSKPLSVSVLQSASPPPPPPPPATTSPSITTQPASETVSAGASATFTAAASGNPTPTVQWEVSDDGGISWTAISGATSTTYTFTSAAYQTAEEYEAVFTNSAGTATTSAATLTVTSLPVVTVQPTSQTVAAGADTSFTARASGNPSPTVQWEVSINGGGSWTAISGANYLTYTFTSEMSQTGDEYEAVFTNSFGSATTSAATLTVTAAVAPQITTQPTSQTVLIGDTARFSAAASGSPTPTVQWQVSTDGGTTWGNIAQATSTSYSFTTDPTESEYEYHAVFTNLAGSKTTNAATLTLGSGNWSGYVDTGGGPFTAVNGSWKVPTIQTCAGGATNSSHWVGIDGWGSDSVEQDGTEADCSGGTPSYDAWVEMYGDNNYYDGDEVELNPAVYPVTPGDAISASVSVVGDTWTLAIRDAHRARTTGATAPRSPTRPPSHRPSGSVSGRRSVTTAETAGSRRSPTSAR